MVGKHLEHILLLCEPSDGETLALAFLAANPLLDIKIMNKGHGLAAVSNQALARSRLVAFLFPEIVPQSVLSRLGFGAYNFHPGPPTYPGWDPISFAIYRQTRQFGSTFHEMAAKPDSGPIIDTEDFEVAPATTHAGLSERTFLASLTLFFRHVPALVNSARPVANPALAWSGTPSRKRDVARLSAMTPDLAAAEILLRQLAFAAAE